ncbi:hypothetical protein [Streptomyces lydicus]|uniref:hypothetical protein n=1 Tax=Streptomyces lydicus TaxID=47763 RepID=UPI001012A52D|nr:hypothetical protein [Streptomyces lydicus]MCZ1006199.1 hypothetical protein [Streptomyces lydicus]
MAPLPGAGPWGYAKAERAVTEAERIAVVAIAQIVTDPERIVTEAKLAPDPEETGQEILVARRQGRPGIG